MPVVTKPISFAGFFNDFDNLWNKAVKLFSDELELASLDSILYVYGNTLENKIADKFSG